MTNKIQLKILTPERVLYDEAVDQISIPTKEGEITILPNHIPLITLLQPGEINIVKEGKSIPLATSGGFAEVTGKKILVLADTAERIEEIDEQRALEAKKRAEEQLKNIKLDSQEYAFIAAKVEKELARLRIYRKHKRKTEQRAVGVK